MIFSGQQRIDAILGEHPGIHAARDNLVEVNFLLPDVYGVSDLAPLDEGQRRHVWEALDYVGAITGIRFIAEGSSDAGSRITFCWGDIADPALGGWTEFNGGTSYDVVLDSVDFPVLKDLAPGGIGFQLLLHEVGHTLGLRHPFEGGVRLPKDEDSTAYTLMSYTWDGVRSQYSPYDMLALHWIYGGDGVRGTYGIGGTQGPALPGESTGPIAHSITAASRTVSESAGGITFTVLRSGNTAAPSAVPWSVQGSASLADFGGMTPSGIVAFAAGETSRAVTIHLSDDDIREDADVVTILLGTPSGDGAVIASPRSVSVTVLDDDTPPLVSIVPTAQGLEGSMAQPGLITFPILRTGQLNKPSVIEWKLVPESADASDFDGHFLPNGGRLAFEAGQSASLLQIRLSGDGAHEPHETFRISISGVSFATVSGAEAIGTILDDDPQARTVTGTPDRHDDVAAVRGSRADYALQRDPKTGIVEVLDLVPNRDGRLLLSDIDVLRFSDASAQILPRPHQLLLQQLAQACLGPDGLDSSIYTTGLEILRTEGAMALARAAALAFFSEASPQEMAIKVAENLMVSSATLTGPGPQAAFGATLDLLTSLYQPSLESRAVGLLFTVEALATMTSREVYGRAATALNERLAYEWLTEFAFHPVTLAGLPEALSVFDA